MPPAQEERRRLELILVGFGNVARRAVRLLEELGSRLPFDTRVIAILTGRHGAAWSDNGVDALAEANRVESGAMLDGWPSSLPPPESAGGSNAHIIDALAECHAGSARERRLVCIETTILDIRSGEPATSHVRAALNAGAHAITANKGPVAFAYADLAALARLRHREFLFEGAVMDGIPIFNLVRETMPGVVVERFRGVVNSTTNHMLTCLEKGRSFDEALSEMQAQGIAEADPTLDVEGWDSAAKTAALMNVLMGARLTPHDIEREGIRHVSHDQVQAALTRGQRLRLVASADRQEGRPLGRVRLEHVASEDLLGTLDGQQNALLLGTDVLGEIGIVQRDGGLTQTAYAIVADLARVATRV